MLNVNEAKEQIEQRNRIRPETDLPLVSVAPELRKLYEVQRRIEFEHFLETSPLRGRIEEKLLNRIRRRHRSPTWIPTGFLSGGRLAFHVRTREIMKWVWERQRPR